MSGRYIALDLNRVRIAALPEGRLPRLGATGTAATIGLPECATPAKYNLEWIAASSAPFGPSPVTVPADGEFSVTGWAIDERNHSPAGDVDIVVGNTAASAFYGLDRPDVARYFGVPAYLGSGFTAKLSGQDVRKDASTLSVRILAADRSCYYQGAAVSISAQ